MKILIADDDRITRSLLGRWTVRWGYEVVFAEDGEQALSILLADPEIQICVLDWLMPKKSGPEVCRAIRTAREEPYVYVTLLTSKTETDDVVEGLQAGADDYIHKPCHPLELEVRLRVGRRLVELQSSLIAAREKLRFQATHDPLTQLCNRRAIMDQLAEQMREARDHGTHVSVVMLDVDHFKAINDNFGHHAGDAVLRSIPQRFSTVLRDCDGSGRYGGEEFLLILSDCPAAKGAEVAERVRQVIEASEVEHDGRRLKFTGSFGVAGTDEFLLGDAESLIRAADAALYRAKAAGRNRVGRAVKAEYGRPSLPVPGAA